ncbi:MAG: glycoside hydrolase family 15 protein, partial [Thermoplasmatales archaeon]
IMGGNPIIPIQEDETALVIWAFWQYYLNSFDVEYFYPFYEPMIKKCADFLVRYTDQDGLPKPSYDIWEERYGVHTFTVATVYAALKAASNFAETFGDYGPKERYSESAKKMAESYERLFYSDEKGYYARAIINGIPDFTVDSQNMALFMFGMKDARDPRMRSNMQKIMDKLWVGNSGGLSRYENDNYQRLKPDPKVPGNPWIITTLWASRYFLKIGEKERAMELIKWVLNHSQKSGMLSEQINPYDNTPVSVSPLIWSHAEFIITVLEYLNST